MNKFGSAMALLLVLLTIPSVVAQQERDEEGAEAATQEPMVIEFLNGYSPDVADPIQRESTRIFNGTFGLIRVLANDVECGVVRFQPTDGVDLPARAVVATFVLGLPTQPSECQLEGARVHFVNGYPSELVVDTTLRHGVTWRILNIAPFPPSAGTLQGGDSPVGFPQTGGGGGAGAANSKRVTYTVVAAVLAAAGAVVLASGFVAWPRGRGE